MRVKPFTEVLQEKLNELSAVIPSLITAIAIFLAGWILAKIVRKITARLLAAVGIDKLADKLNEVDLIANSKFELVPSRLLSGLLYYLIMLITTLVAVEALGMDSITQLLTDFINYLPKALSAFVVFLVGLFVIDLIKKGVLTAAESLGIGSAKLMSNIVFYFLFLNVLLITLRQAELQTVFMENNISIVLAGVILAFSIGYGLASRSIMSNMLSGFYNRERIYIGDEISVGEHRGPIVGMDSTSLTLNTKEGQVVIPLAKLSDEKYIIHRRRDLMTLDEGQDA